MNILVFKDKEEFRTKFYALCSGETEKNEFKATLKELEIRSLNSFYADISEADLDSSKSSFKKLMQSGNLVIRNSENGKNLDAVVESDELQLLLDDKRRVQVGDEIYQFELDELKITNVKTNKLRSEKIIRKYPKNIKGSKVAEYQGTEYPYSVGSNDYKYDAGVTYNFNGSLLFNCDVKIIHRKKSFGFFWRSSTYYMKINGTYKGGSQSNPYNPYSYFEECFNCNDLSKTLTNNQYIPLVSEVNHSAQIAIMTGQNFYHTWFYPF